MAKIIEVTYHSYWDCGNIDTSAKLNTETGEIFDIESVDVNEDEDEDYEFCEGEFIEYPDGTMEEVISDDNNDYYIVSKSDEKFEEFETNEIRFIVSCDNIKTHEEIYDMCCK